MKSNPLATRYVAPGKIAWQSHNAPSLSELRSKFVDQLHYRAAIVGPHGSGKSTLLAHLVPMLGNVEFRSATYDLGELASAPDQELAQTEVHDGRMRRVIWLQLRGRAASGRLLRETRSRWTRHGALLVIDGYEQLSRFSRALVLSATRLFGNGLLVTSHHTVCLPTLVRTQVDALLARQILDRALPDDTRARERLLDTERLDGLLEKHHGNMRELFMELYDELQ